MTPNLSDILTLLQQDREHGARYLIDRLLIDLERALDAAPVDEALLVQLPAFASALQHVRHGMAPFASIGWQIHTVLDGENPAVEQLDRLRALVHTLRQQVAAAPQRIADALRRRLPDGAVVVTMSRSGTVLATLAANRDRVDRLVVLESRPGGEGIVFAGELAQEADWQIDLFPDMALRIALAGAACVVLGADALFTDGAAANKIGSAVLALAARDAGCPVFVLAERLKRVPPGFQWDPETLPSEVLTADPPAGVHIHVPIFERIPADLFTLLSD